MSRLIRDAIDALLVADDDLDATFGSSPNIANRPPSRAEWDQRA